jgi:prephenate dehydratase
MKKIGYLGPEGTFSHEVAETSATLLEMEMCQLAPFPSIPDVLTAVDTGKVDLGVVPVENAIEGSVTASLDWLVHQVDLPIVAEFIYPISQCIMVNPAKGEMKATDVEKIYSHPQAIAQCRVKLKTTYPQAELVFTDSTSQGALLVASHPDESWLAIGAKQAAKIHQLEIVEAHAEDHPNNVTRFVMVSKEQCQWEQSPIGYKTSLQVILPKDYPGALYQVLATFSWRNINLSHIESRPTKTGLGNYFFLIDVELPVDHVLMKGAQEEIKSLGCQLRVLGSYPCFSFLTQTIH